jgi:hypothetical protein
VPLLFLALKMPTTAFLDVCKQLPYRLLKSNTKYRGHSIDVHFKDATGSMSELFFPWKAVITLFMNGRSQSPLRLHKMHSQKSLTLLSGSLSEWGCSRVIYCSAKEGCQYVGYEWQQPGHFSITVHVKQKIVDAPLQLILRIGQGE